MSEKDVARAEKEGLEKFFKLTASISTSNMICFDSAGKIHKYETPEDILEDFYHLRLQWYAKRKQHVSNEMELELDRLNNQARFVQMIVDKKLVVANRKKEDIVKELRELQFTPFPKSPKTKKQDDTEAVVENDIDEDDVAVIKGLPSNSDFDYLLGMAIWNLTREKIEKLRANAKEQEDKLLAYLKLTPIDLWNSDLDQFLEGWEAVIEQDIAEEQGNKPKKKGTTIKTRKSLVRRKNGDYGDSDDEDFAAAAKSKKAGSRKNEDEGPKRTAASKAKIAAAAAVFGASDNDEDEDEDEEPRRNRISLVASRSEPSDTEMKPAPRAAPKAAPKKATAPKKTAEKRKSDAMSLDGSDSEVYVKPAPKKKQKTLDQFISKPKATKAPTAKKPPPAPKKTKAILSDEDDDSDPISSKPRTPPPKRTVTARAGVAKKPAYVDLTSDDEDGGGGKIADETQDAFELSD